MGSSKLLAIAALAAVAAAACANGDATTNQVKDAMRNAGANDDQAECIGNKMTIPEDLTQDQLNDVAKAKDLSELAGEEIAGSDEDLQQVLRGVLAECLGEENPDTTESQEGDEPSSGEGSDTTQGEGESPSEGE